MSRRNWLWYALSGSVLVLTAALGYAGWRQMELGTAQQAYICPLTGETLPCPQCCPLAEQYVCPLTGEALPCPQCCPLQASK
jgi:hypothetical protein